MPLSSLELNNYHKKLDDKMIALVATNRKYFQFKHKGNVFIYYSVGNRLENFNMDFSDKDNKPITCRHLARYWLLENNSKKSNSNSYHNTFYQPQNLPFLANNDYDTLRLEYKDSAYYFIDLNNLGHYLSELARPLGINEQVALAFNSENHAMGFKIQHKDVGFRIKFYDPNKTVVHQQNWFPDVDSIAKLKIGYFLTSEAKNTYFPKFQGILSVVTSVEQQVKETMPLVMVDENLSGENILYYGLSKGFPAMVEISLKRLLEKGQSDLTLSTSNEFSSNQKLTLLSAKDANGTLGLFLALQNGHSEVVKFYITAIIGCDQLNADQKFALLEAKDILSSPGLYFALQQGHTEMVKFYIEAIIKSDLNADQKLNLIGAKKADGTSGLFITLVQKQIETVNVYIEAIIQSNLSSDHKLDLLGVKDAKGEPALLLALFMEDIKVAKVYIKAIIKSDLSSDHKLDLLGAKNAKGEPALFLALFMGDIKVAKFYIKAIIKSDLNSDQKLYLLGAKDANGRAGLFFPLFMGDFEVVKAYIKAIIKSDLNLDQKLDLLAAKDAEGVPGLSIAAKCWHKELTDFYMDLIIKKDAFDLLAPILELLVSTDPEHESVLSIALDDERHIDSENIKIVSEEQQKLELPELLVKNRNIFFSNSENNKGSAENAAWFKSTEHFSKFTESFLGSVI